MTGQRRVIARVLSDAADRPDTHDLARIKLDVNVLDRAGQSYVSRR